MKFETIVEKLQEPAKGVLPNRLLSKEDRKKLQQTVLREVRALFKQTFGDDWSAGHRRTAWLYSAFKDRVRNAGPEDDVLELQAKLRRSLQDQIESSTALMSTRVRRRLGHKMAGRTQVAKMGSWRELVRASHLAQVRTFLSTVYESWECHGQLKVAYDVFQERYDALQDDECPLELINAFMAMFREGDFLDYRRREGTLRRQTKRANKVARGEIKGVRKRRSSGSSQEQVEESDDEYMTYPALDFRPGRDLLFPLNLGYEEMERFLDTEEVDLHLDGSDEDGTPLVTLVTDENGAWAIYRATANGYVRTFMDRPGRVGPVRGKDLGLHARRSSKVA